MIKNLNDYEICCIHEYVKFDQITGRECKHSLLKKTMIKI